MSYHNPAAMADNNNDQGQRQGMPSGYMAANGAPHDVAAARGMHYPAGHHDSLGGLVSHFGTLGMANNNLPQGPAPVAMPPTGYMTADASAMYPNAYGSIAGPYMAMQTADPIYGPGIPGGHHFMPQGGVPGAYGHYVYPINTPGRNPSYGDRVDRGLRDMPALDNRRGSYSTTATESTPGTPFFGAVSDRNNAPRILSADRSSYTTPSPQQLAMSGMVGQATKVKRVAEVELRDLVEQDPKIPAAVPAVFTTPEQRKSLDQCLENRIEGNKNVYIRGLHPTTDDELLLHYASRFGEVEQSKAIIDTATGACKGQVSLLFLSL